MKATVVIKEEVGINFPEDWVLTFQKVIYMYFRMNTLCI